MKKAISNKLHVIIMFIVFLTNDKILEYILKQETVILFVDRNCYDII